MVYSVSYTNYSIHITFLLLKLLALTCAQTAINCTRTECQSSTIHSGQISCTEPNSCQDSTLTSNDGQNGYIECSGYQSCYETISIKSATDVYCSGSNSCQFSNSIDASNIYCTGFSGCTRAKLTTAENVYCYGLNGCGGAKIESDADTFCSAFDACSNAVIIGGKSANCEAYKGCYGARITNVNNIGCMGTESCRSATISSGNSALGYGYQSIYDTTITGITKIRGWAYQSLMNVTIDSDGLSKMTVEVYGDSYKSQVICRSGSTCTVKCKGTSCEGITYVCLSGATCNVSPAKCSSDNSVADVDGETCPIFTDILSLKAYAMDWYFDDVALIEADCDRSTNCDSEKECTALNFTRDTTMRCNGEESCMNAIFTETAVMCEGSRSCAGDVFENDGRENTFCNGYKACYNTQGSIGKTDFLGSGHFPCSGELACAEAKLEVHGDISCKGAYSCTKSVIHLNTTGNATINLEGWQAGTRSYMGGMFNQVNIYGYLGLFYGTIDTAGNEMPEINVNVFGHLAGLLGNIVCRSGKECTINCKSTGCQRLYFVCETGAICNVNPVECAGKNTYQGVDCPVKVMAEDADEYMDRKYVMEKDDMDRFDEYLDNIMENDGLGYDDYEDIMMFIEDKMIFVHGKILNDARYDYMEHNAVRIVGCVFIIIGCVMCLWYILTKECKIYKEDEYIVIN